MGAEIKGVVAVAVVLPTEWFSIRLSGWVSSKRKYAITIDTTSKEEQTRLGKRYGNVANSPAELNRVGKFSAGCENKPPIDAARSVTDHKAIFGKSNLTADDCANAPYKWHDGVCPWFMFRIPDQLTHHGLYYS